MVSDLNIFAHNWSKIAAAKKVFLRIFFICSLRLNVFFPPVPEVQCLNFLDIRNPWGKVMERSGLRFEIFCSKMVLNCHGKKSFFTDFFHLFASFKRLFAPISRSPMSKLFRFSESLGKSNGKKGSQIWTLFLIKGVKSPRKKVSFFGEICLTSRIF